jgi:hydrogenase assembly chaperone HypC/HupF
MCLTAPAQVLAVAGAVATIDVAGQRRTASTLAVPGVQAGDWALVAAGTIVRVIDAARAAELERAIHIATGADR